MNQLPQTTLPQQLLANSRDFGSRTAIRQKDFGIWNPVDWAGYADRSALTGHGFAALGLKTGGHVAILAENRIEWVLTQMGAGLVGAITIGVYSTSPASEVEYVLNHSDAEIVVCEDQEQVDKVLESLPRLPLLRKIVVMESKGMRGYADSVITFDALTQMGAQHRQQNPDLIAGVMAAQSLDDEALMIYTSGSTGKPKGAILTYRNLRAQADATIDRLGLSASDTHLSYLPLCHVAEQFMTTMAPIYLGSQVNFGESIRTVQEDLREVAPTMFLGVPRIWEKLQSSIHIRMLEAGPLRRGLYERAFAACEPFAEKTTDEMTAAERRTFRFWQALVFRPLMNYIGLTRCHIAMTGAAPIPPRVVTFFRTMGVPLIELYGATETSGVILGQRLQGRVAPSVGLPVKNAQVKLTDEGEILLKGDLVFKGYYKDPEATRNTIIDGWLSTGDVARIDDKGNYFIIDRMKDIMITAGGKNLSPSEIENTVKASPYIKECVSIAERRQFVSALIQIDYDTTSKWAEENGIPHTNFRNLAENPQVRAMIEAEILAANAQMAQVSHIRKFHLLTKELDHDDDEMTATMKVRRTQLYSRYSDAIEAMYA